MQESKASADVISKEQMDLNQDLIKELIKQGALPRNYSHNNNIWHQKGSHEL